MNTAPQLPDDVAVGDRHRLTWTEAGLKAIRRAELDLCVWRRGFDSSFAAWAQQLARAQELAIDEVVPLDRLPLERWLGHLPRSVELDTLRDDLADRALAYARLLRCAMGRVQVHTVHHQHCPRFHVDSVGVRLICTWAGPATEWIAETELVRSLVGPGRPAGMPVKEGAAVRQFERFDVALMKGSAWPGNARRGLVHRSPVVTNEPRLVFTIDAKD